MLNGHDNSKRRQTTKGQIAMVAAMGFATAAAVNPEDGKRGRIAPWRCSSASAGSVVRLCRPVPRGRRLCRAPHPRRRSRAGQMGGPGFRDLLHLAPKAGHDAAAWVVERGRATGAEHIAVVDNRTGEIVHAGTNGLTCNFWLDFVSAPAERDAYHPGSTAIPPKDIRTLADPGIRAVHAHDGNFTRVSPGAHADGTHRCQCPQKHKGIERGLCRGG